MVLDFGRVINLTRPDLTIVVPVVGATALAAEKVCASYDALSHREVCQCGMRSHLSAVRQAPGLHVPFYLLLLRMGQVVRLRLVADGRC
jgi:hypothetical protein